MVVCAWPGGVRKEIAHVNDNRVSALLVHLLIGECVCNGTEVVECTTLVN